jgi:hypothetical protein
MALLTITVLFLIGALVAFIASALGKSPLWVGCVLLWVVVALSILPVK